MTTNQLLQVPKGTSEKNFDVEARLEDATTVDISFGLVANTVIEISDDTGSVIETLNNAGGDIVSVGSVNVYTVRALINKLGALAKGKYDLKTTVSDGTRNEIVFSQLEVL